MRRKNIEAVRLRHFVSMFEELRYMQKNGDLCDVHLSVNAGTIPAHSLVLASSSSYFHKLLSDTLTKHSTDEPATLVFDDVDYKSMCTIVEFIYSGYLDISSEDNVEVENLKIACQRFQLNTAEEMCQQFLISKKKMQRRTPRSMHTRGSDEFSVKKRILDQYSHLDPKIKDEPADTTSSALDTQNSLNLGEFSSATCIAKDLISDILDEVCGTRKRRASTPAQAPLTSLNKRRKRKRASFKMNTSISNKEVEDLVTDDNCEDDDNVSLNISTSENGSWEATYFENLTKAVALAFSKHEIVFPNQEESTENDELHGDPDRPMQRTGEASTKKRLASKRLPRKVKVARTRRKKPDRGEVNTSPTYCKLCNIEIGDAKSYEEHCKFHTTKTHHRPKQCNICGKWLRCNTNLAMHRFGKHGMPFDETKFVVFKCDIPKCTFTTIISWDFKQHMEVAHSANTPFFCEKCGKGFRQKSVLQAHLATHTSERNFKCGECEQVFATIAGRDTHVKRIHRREASYMCHLCSCTYFENHTLLQHLHKEHNIPMPEKYVRYKCDECDYETFAKKTFTNHKAVHRGVRAHMCPVCGRCFTSDGTLHRHMAFHKDPVHKCPHCDYAAVRLARLKEHIRLKHTDQHVKPHACYLCNYTCALKGNLKLHLVKTHKLDLPWRKLSIGNRISSTTVVSNENKPSVSESVAAAPKPTIIPEHVQMNPTEIQNNRDMASRSYMDNDANVSRMTGLKSPEDQSKQNYHVTKPVQQVNAPAMAISSVCPPGMPQADISGLQPRWSPWPTDRHYVPETVAFPTGHGSGGPRGVPLHMHRYSHPNPHMVPGQEMMMQQLMYMD